MLFGGVDNVGDPSNNWLSLSAVMLKKSFSLGNGSRSGVHVRLCEAERANQKWSLSWRKRETQHRCTVPRVLR